MDRSAIRVVDTKPDPALPQNSGVPEFCHYYWRKSETSDLRRHAYWGSFTIVASIEPSPAAVPLISDRT